MKKTYTRPSITTFYNDLSVSIAMSSDWSPGDGKPPWSGGGDNGGRPKQKENSPFGGNSPFTDTPFDSNPF
ncbi:hypothetical protein [Carboxylicivirga marina]|uniref:Single-stranded DNA-binding protein n=1 Tax=Carboxylicivirga marina TaxID=2800988 RepID=A0ABS1HHM3_9BACT|nr:hypothetical protein [Carboxylicivirga marina]MBK3517057.1 hypothetical protein [Carboxylicivirga marina]